MKKLLLTLILLTSSLLALKAQGTWTPRDTLPNDSDAVFQGIPGFTIGNYSYGGLGEFNTGKYHNYIWQFDPFADSWTQKAPFPGQARVSPANFVVGKNAYIVTGAVKNYGTCVTECWQYNSTTDTWTQKANFPGTARVYAVGFAIGGKGYVGLGAKGGIDFRKDFYSYDTATNTWTRIADFGGIARDCISGFAVNGKGYVCFGQDSLYNRYKDMWEYDTGTNAWTQKSSYPGLPIYGTSGFSIGNNIYVGFGEDSVHVCDRILWLYNTTSDIWVQMASIPEPGGAQGYAFAIGDTGYYGFGVDSADEIPNQFDKFYSGENAGINNISENSNNELLITPNPFKDECSVTYANFEENKPDLIQLYDLEGKLIEINIKYIEKGFILYRGNLPSGVYILSVQFNNKIMHQKLIINN